ncbi:BrnA antitoxin family protein [Rhizobium sp. XQZ8]|nr:BrnA antitoxin family protein [Rhizobium populisoli]
MSRKILSEADRLELAELEARADQPIDTSDIPEITEEQWRLAQRGNLYRPIKKSVTIRLDADVVEWFKTHASAGYQTEINSVLRRHVTRQDKKSA